MLPPGHEPLLRAICAEPDDDTVRLVFADWLDENGAPERAEFIRLQIAEQREPAESKRAHHLRVTWGPTWRLEVPRDGVDPGGFRRGFVDTLHFRSARFFHTHARAVLAATPATDVRLPLSAGEVSGVLNSPHARRIGTLRIWAGATGDNVLMRLADCDALERLQELVLHGGHDDPSGARGASITNRGVLVLLHSAKLKGLRKVSLSGASCSVGVRDEFRQRFGPYSFLS